MGICNTDIELLRGYRGFQGRLGHEFVGVVIEGPSAWLGARVVGEINLVCGVCDMCQRGASTQCRQRRVLGISGGATDGAFAETFRLPLANLHRIPDSVHDRQAVFTEPLAAACRLLEQRPLQTGEKVLLIGAGKLGLLCAQVLAQAGGEVGVVIRRPEQAALLEKWGLRPLFAEAIPPAQADVVVDCTGTEEGFMAALHFIRPQGTLMLKSTFAGLTPANLTAVAVSEIQIIGSRCGPFDKALAHLLAGTVAVEDLIQGVYPLKDFPRALDHARGRGVLKILLENG
jgi:threonine dehydrogenase-like Zn-dependent dehydrogenase